MTQELVLQVDAKDVRRFHSMENVSRLEKLLLGEFLNIKKSHIMEEKFHCSTDNAVVGANPETYEIGCVTPLENSKPGTVISGVTNCPKGNKRDINNQC